MTKRAKFWYDGLVTMFAEWFGVGRLKPPGTMGSLAALPILCLLQLYGGTMGVGIFTALVTLVGFVVVPFYQRQHQNHDAATVVIDEVAGISLTLCFLSPDPLSYVLGFILFRLCDILKPYPIYLIDRHLKNGAGVMLDDLLAGVYAGLLGLGIGSWLEGLF
ncbi:MAG: phosphatidylglycerophosphatase A [Alphaproteobacteria bacterium]|nr:phosphatidylglycerophosphatase A [Alphaproteobacteria bacterium]